MDDMTDELIVTVTEQRLSPSAYRITFVKAMEVIGVMLKL